MADSKPWVKQSGVFKMLLLVMVLLWMGNVLSQGNAGGQTPPSPPLPPEPTQAAPRLPVLVQSLVGIGGIVTRPANRFHFQIPTDAPLKDLLPIPPRDTPRSGSFIDDLAQVPEVAFQAPLAKNSEALKLTAHTMAKINHLNKKQPDGFMKALLGERADLAGLPMAMGDACRMKGERSQYFSQALAAIKRAKGQGFMGNFITSSAVPVSSAPLLANLPPAAGQSGAPVPPPAVQPPPVVPLEVKASQQVQTVDFVKLNGGATAFMGVVGRVDPDAFWDQFQKICAEEDKANANLDPGQLEQVTLARIAALMQVMAPESIAMRKSLVKYLARTSHAEATRALARLAIFTADDAVRNPAIEALKVRRDKDYTEILLRGLRYPLPAVARRATEAMVKLERADMVPELVNFLDEPDPRAPTLQEIGDKKVPVIRELVRLDVTYLRQDFSLLQPVADAQPWPEMQRFDFLVRTRTLTEKEARALPAAKAGVSSPYQRVALAALRELTGRDTTPTPEAWRQLLDLPGRDTEDGALE